jgi:type I restriction enzyme M protein
MLISAVAWLKAHNKEWRNVKLYGQEINALTSSIARMNLFLHGVKDFEVVNDDTLANPAFIDQGRIRTFDIVVANPPYSIKQWNQAAFAADKYGRNFLGTPPQGRADYAFFQHILKSLDPRNGRCAILFPHGVLFRAEENALREKLIRADLVESVIGLGANLFFNSPMEACVVICRTNKKPARRGKMLLINAVNEVTRKNAQSWLEDGHIKKIADAYEHYETIEGFAQVVTIADAEKNGFSLSIPLYVKEAIAPEAKDTRSFAECLASWREKRFDAQTAYAELEDLLNER